MIRAYHARMLGKFPKCLALICFLVIALFGLWFTLPVYASDWDKSFRPAAWDYINFQSPYHPEQEAPFANAPWILPILAPFALLPTRVGRLAFFIFNFACYLYTLRQLKATRLATILFLLSPPVIKGLIEGQVDSIIMVGYTMPPMIGLFFLAAKPQIGIGLAVYWLYQAWQNGGVKQVIITFAPASIITGLAMAFHPGWLKTMTRMPNIWWNTSLWPYGILVGAILLVTAIRSKRPTWAISSSVFLTPYLTRTGWGTALIGLVDDNLLMLTGFLTTWAILFLSI